MSNEQLNQIERRLQNSTKGPWVEMIEGVNQTNGGNFIMTGVQSSEDYQSVERDIDLYIVNGTKDDLIFIANAKQDIPKLIAEIRKLKKEYGFGH